MSDDFFKTQILQVSDVEFIEEPSSEDPSIKLPPGLSKRQKAALSRRLRTRTSSAQNTDELNQDAQDRPTMLINVHNTPTVVENERPLLTPEELQRLKDVYQQTNPNPNEPIPRSTIPVTSNAVNRMLDMAGKPSQTLFVSREEQSTNDPVSMLTLPLPTKVLRDSLDVMSEGMDDLNQDVQDRPSVVIDAQNKPTMVIFTQANSSGEYGLTPEEHQELKDVWKLRQTQINPRPSDHKEDEPIPRSTIPVTSNALNRMLDMAGKPSQTLFVSREEHREGELTEDNTKRTRVLGAGLSDELTCDVFGDQHNHKAHTQIIEASALRAMNFDEED